MSCYRRTFGRYSGTTSNNENDDDDSNSNKSKNNHPKNHPPFVVIVRRSKAKGESRYKKYCRTINNLLNAESSRISEHKRPSRRPLSSPLPSLFTFSPFHSRLLLTLLSLLALLHYMQSNNHTINPTSLASPSNLRSIPRKARARTGPLLRHDLLLCRNTQPLTTSCEL